MFYVGVITYSFHKLDSGLVPVKERCQVWFNFGQVE